MQRSFIFILSILALAAVPFAVRFCRGSDEIAVQDPCTDARDTWSNWTPRWTSDPEQILAEQRAERFRMVRDHLSCFNHDEIDLTVDGYWQTEWTAFERSVANLQMWPDRQPITQRLTEVVSRFPTHLDPVQQAQLECARAFELARETASLDGYRVAIERVRPISVDTADIQALRQLTQIDLVMRAYKHLYSATTHNTDEEQAFRADFPIATYVDPAVFAKEVGIILPPDFYREAGIAPEAMSEVLALGLLERRWSEDREAVGKAWIQKGHDPGFIWGEVVNSHIRQNDWRAAMSLAVRELGARDVKAVEDLRIAYLREQGKWMILENPDGSHVRVYPTWDEEPS